MMYEPSPAAAPKETLTSVGMIINISLMIRREASDL
jgi:hypothetical protein